MGTYHVILNSSVHNITYLKKIRQIEIQVFLDAAPCLQAMLGDPEEWSSNLHRDVSNSAATDTAKRP